MGALAPWGRLALLAPLLLVLAAVAEASLPRPGTPETFAHMDESADALHDDAWHGLAPSLLPAPASDADFTVFTGNELSTALDPRASRFALDLGAEDLDAAGDALVPRQHEPGLNLHLSRRLLAVGLLRGPPDEGLKTRIGVFEVFGAPVIGIYRGVTLELQWGYGEFGLGISEGLLQGAWTDPITGLQYKRARWYDPRTATWLSEDPLDDVDSPNLYGYVAGKPHESTDPMGLQMADPGSESLRSRIRLQGFHDQAQIGSGVIANSLEMAVDFGPGIGQVMNIGHLLELVHAGHYAAAAAVAGGGYGTVRILRYVRSEAPVLWQKLMGKAASGERLDAADISQLVRVARSRPKVEKEVLAAAKGIGKSSNETSSQISKWLESADESAGITLSSRGVITRLDEPGRAIYNGFEVRGMRDLDHYTDSALEAMAKKGFSAKDKLGRPLRVHHMNQNPAGPLVEIPIDFHLNANKAQHPLGNTPGVGLTTAERADFDSSEYWKARAREALDRRARERAARLATTP